MLTVKINAHVFKISRLLFDAFNSKEMFKMRRNGRVRNNVKTRIGPSSWIITSKNDETQDTLNTSLPFSL